MALPFRNIQEADNIDLAKIIREGIESLGLPKEGTAHSDPSTDQLYQYFQRKGADYLVLEKDRKILGGCGIYPSPGLPPNHAELVRFFLHQSVRGLGYGKQLMQACEELAIQSGYTHLYLESFPNMEAAIHLYEQFGYEHLKQPLGNTGHFSCNVWMLKKL